MSGIWKKLGLDRPELRAWAMYDWANSAMVCTIITAVFPIYFNQVAFSTAYAENATVRRALDHDATRVFALATTIGMTIIAVLAPVLGAVADISGRKKRMLGAFLALGAGSVAAMFFIERGDWFYAALLFVLANIGANGSFVFYDALLPHIARDDEVDRVSTAGYALGYLGGGILLALNLAWISKPEWFGLPHGEGLTASQQTLPARLSFLSVAVWWLAFSVPLFRRVPEPAGRRAAGDKDAPAPGLVATVRESLARLAHTGRALRQYRQAFLMLLAFLIFNDGIGTIMRMAGIYATVLHIDKGTTIASILIVQFVGVPCAFLFGALAGRIGVKPSIMLGLLVYAGICVFGYFMTSGTHFLILALLVGTVQGGTQALSRSLFATLVPRDQSGEFFGFFGTVEKFAGILGPAIFIFVPERAAILAIIVFFLVGAGLLVMVDIEEGQRVARAADDGENT